MILITGATGNLGRKVIKQLSKIVGYDQFVALVRNSEKAKEVLNPSVQTRLGDFDKPDTLESAFKGIDKLLLISTMEMHRLDQHKAVVDAAKKSGVKHIYYTGMTFNDIKTSAVKDLMISHFQTEEYIQQSGLDYTIMRNTMYSEALLDIMGPQMKEGKVSLPAGNGKVPFALRDELAEGIGNIMTQSGHTNKTYKLTGSSVYTISEIVKALGAFKNEPLEYVDISKEEYIKQLQAIQFPEFLIFLHQGTVEDIKNGQQDCVTDTLELALGRKTASLTKMVETVFG